MNHQPGDDQGPLLHAVDEPESSTLRMQSPDPHDADGTDTEEGDATDGTDGADTDGADKDGTDGADSDGTDGD